MSTFARGSRNLYSDVEFTVQISSNSMTSFLLSVFKLILSNIGPKKFLKKLKLHVQYFLGRPTTFYVKKKLKSVRVVARSIWTGILHFEAWITFTIHDALYRGRVEVKTSNGLYVEWQKFRNFIIANMKIKED